MNSRVNVKTRLLNKGFSVVELVTAIAITSIFSTALLLALVEFEKAQNAQETQLGVMAQLRYQCEVIRGMPLETLQNLFNTAGLETISRTGANDLELYGVFNPDSRQTSVTWTRLTLETDPGSGDKLLGIRASVSAPLSVYGGQSIVRQNTVLRALE